MKNNTTNFLDMAVRLPVSPWLGDVLSAAVGAIDPRLTAANPQMTELLRIPAASSVIVIVVDGLGWLPLQDRKGHAPTLRGHFGDTTVIDTCLPSTTASALTALATGRLPGATNMVGYSVAHGLKTMNLLHFANAIVPEQWQQCPTIFETLQGTGIESVVITTPKFMGSGLTRAAMRGAEFCGVTSLSDRFEMARSQAEQGAKLIYLYWSEIDHAGHSFGVNSDEWIAQLEHFDQALGVFLRNPPHDTTIILTADHGMVDVEERIDIADHPQLSQDVRILAGEGRAVHVHAAKGAAEQVWQRWTEHLGERALVLEPSQYEGVFGQGPGNSLLGDAVVFLKGNSVIVDSRQHTAAMIGQQGVHGSFTDAEMKVPVMILG